MIDYEKLKLAHRLNNKAYLKIIPIFGDSGEMISFNYFAEIKGRDNYFDNIDDLIAFLQELTEPKYKIGDKVWFVDSYQGLRELIITEINAPNYMAETGFWSHEKDLYPTEQALIEAQIAYWQSLLEPVLADVGSKCPKCHQLIFTDTCPCFLKPAKEECQHESNNIKYIMNPGSEGLEFPASKCKKCGEFYR